MRVLVVQPEPARAPVMDALAALGHEADPMSAADAARACHTADAVVVEGDLAAIRAVLAERAHAAVVLLDPDADPAAEEAAGRLGDVEYVTSADPAALRRALRCAITRRALAESEERLTLAMRDGLWDWDLRADRVHFSPRWKAMLGHAGEEIGEAPDEWLGRVHPDDAPPLREALDAYVAGTTSAFEHEHRLRHQDGEHRWMLARGTAVRDGEGRAVRVVGSHTDVTARKRAERRLQHDALHDALTGLPNRVLFLDRLDQAIRRAERAEPDAVAAALFLDLDRFKLVNDSLGHQTGDELLKAVAQRLEAALRPPDTVARLGGDEFTILLDGISDPQEAVAVAERVQHELQRPFAIAGRRLFLDASVGIALARAGADPAAVLRDADVAMYRAKAAGPGRHAVFDERMHDQVVRRLDMEGELRRAIDGDALELAFQPIVQAATGRIAGFEALCRWPDGAGGFVDPGEFLPIAEETGLIVPLGIRVLEAACVQLATWRAAPSGASLTVGVNVSRRQLADPGWGEALAGALAGARLDPAALRLEVKERDLAEAPEEVLAALERAAVQAHLDDFGLGAWSLKLLHAFPGDAVKLHRRLVAGMGREPGVFAIVQALAGLAHALGLHVIAEGVESGSQLEHLRLLGCELAQGFHVGPPVPAEAATALLDSAAAAGH